MPRLSPADCGTPGTCATPAGAPSSTTRPRPCCDVSGGVTPKAGAPVVPRGVVPAVAEPGISETIVLSRRNRRLDQATPADMRGPKLTAGTHHAPALGPPALRKDARSDEGVQEGIDV